MFDASDLSGLASGLSSDAVYAAVAVLRRECGWHIAPVWAQTVRVDVDLQRHAPFVLMLPTLHLVSVESVTDTVTGAVITDYRKSRRGWLERNTPWPVGAEAVEVAFTHGLSVLPGELMPIVADLATQGVNSIQGRETMGPFTFDASVRIAEYDRAMRGVVDRFRIPVFG